MIKPINALLLLFALVFLSACPARDECYIQENPFIPIRLKNCSSHDTLYILYQNKLTKNIEQIDYIDSTQYGNEKYYHHLKYSNSIVILKNCDLILKSNFGYADSITNIEYDQQDSKILVRKGFFRNTYCKSYNFNNFSFKYLGNTYYEKEPIYIVK